MSPKRKPLAEFLERYRTTLAAVAALGRAAGVERTTILNEILKRPLSMPSALKGVQGAAEVAASLRALTAERETIDADSRAIDVVLAEVAREVFAPPREAEEFLRGRPRATRGVGQRAKPPMAGPPPPPSPAPPPKTKNGGSRTTRGVQPGLLGAEPPTAVAPPPPQAAPVGAPQPRKREAEVRDERWINAELEDHPKTLEVKKTYTLAFDVDVEQRETAVGSSRFPDALLFPEGVEEVELTVQLDSNDFAIQVPIRPLFIPRTGKSRGKARFDITPKHGGASTIKATFHKDRNFVQQMDLTFQVGSETAKPVDFKATGRPPAAATILRPRDLSISITRAAGDEYDCVVVGAVSGRARLRIQQAQLGSAIDAARDELMRVVTHEDSNGNAVFQIGLDIPAADQNEALRIMARAGALLFQQIFFGPAAGDDSKRIGTFLRQVAGDKKTKLKLQIVAESAPLPWGLLYIGDASSKAKLDWDNFLGMRHVIEQIPLQNTLTISDSAIPSDDPDLAVSINLNTDIDRQMQATFVAEQRKYWADTKAARKRMRVTSRTKRDEVVKALASNRTADQILYFYCHAESAGLGVPGGPEKSCLVLSDARLTLGDLNLDAPTDQQLKGKPLVFINACESAQLSSTFYDGFVPYFMSKGARGVIGTECKTPALFAAEWAKRFFERFLDGVPLGDTFLELRREFLKDHNNPLGLLYAVHCDGDTQIEPALAHS